MISAIPTLKIVKHLSSVGVLALILIFANSQPAYAKIFNVGRSYQEALTEYKKGRPAAALKILSKIHKKYPGFKPAQALSGKIYYQMGKLERAARFFKRAGAESILPDNAFAYGSSMFAVGHFREAAKGFREVPKQSKERAYADFYSGIAQFRLQRYGLALARLRRANDRDLPVAFRKAKRKLLKVIEQKIVAERRGGAIAPSGPYVYVPPPPAPQAPFVASAPASAPSPEPGTAAKKEDKKPEKKPEAPTTGVTYTITPSGTYTVEDTQESGPVIEKKTQNQATSIGASGVVNYLFEPSMGEQPLIGLTLSGKMTSNSNKETNVSLFAYEDDPDTILATETAKRTAGKTQEIMAAPNASAALTEEVSADIKYTYTERVVDGKQDTKATETAPFGQIDAQIGDVLNASFTGSTKTKQVGGKPGSATDTIYGLSLSTTIDDYTLKGGYKVTETDNPEYGTLGEFQSKSTFDINLSGSIADISGNLGGSLTSNTPPPGVDVNGPASTLTLSGSVTIPFSFGTSLILEGGQTQFKDVRSASLKTGEKDDKDNDVVTAGVAQKEEMRVAASLKIAPVDWAYLKLGMEQKTTTVTASDSAQQEAFDRDAITDYLKTYIELGLSKTL